MAVVATHVRVLTVAALVLSAASSASAHAVLVSPLPRDSSDSHKDPNGPCGITRSPAPAQPEMRVQPGQAVTVAWDETVTHPGCFVVDLSRAADGNWEQLAVVKETSAGANPRRYTKTVTLPSDLACDGCTLRVRQLMLGADTDPCPPATIAQGATYYTCANVRTTEPPDAGTPVGGDDAGTQTGDDAGTQAGVDAGNRAADAGSEAGTHAVLPAPPSSGCAVSSRTTSHAGWLATLFGVALLVRLARRRRYCSPPSKHE